MIDNIYFYILITIISYIIGVSISNRIKNPIANPMLISIILMITIFYILEIDYANYMKGGQFIGFFVGLATVSLVVPLFNNIDLVMNNIIPVIVGITIGSLTSIISVLLLCKIFNVEDVITISLLPQSVTTAIAMPLAENYNGLGSLAVFAVIYRGILGSIISSLIFKKLSINSTIAQGLTLGTNSHVIGTSKAFDYSYEHGAMSSLAIAISGVLTTIYMPFIISFV